MKSVKGALVLVLAVILAISSVSLMSVAGSAEYKPQLRYDGEGLLIPDVILCGGPVDGDDDSLTPGNGN